MSCPLAHEHIGENGMPVNVQLVMHKSHQIRKNQGFVQCVPALESQGRLYAVLNTTTSRHVYIGTASNLQSRFTERIAAVRELGFNNAAINPITIYAIRVIIDGHPRQPNNLGIAGGIDVEHLLIRLHINQGVSVRNISKLIQYTNNTGTVMNLSLTTSPAVGAVPAYLGGAPVNVAIASGNRY